MRVPVVDRRGVQLMPCTPAKARSLLKSGCARPKRNKLGLFYIQLMYEQEPYNQPLVAGIDPGSAFEGYSVVGTKDAVLNLMAEAPDRVKEAVEVRRRMRRARRHRKWRRPKRFDNRLNRKNRIPPSTRSRWEAKARVMDHLLHILPLTDVVVEDVQAVTRPGKGGKWNRSFSPVQVGKEHFYRLLGEMGLVVHTVPGWGTKALRERYGLLKKKSKNRQCFESHAVDSWVLAASVSEASHPTCTRLWYLVPTRLHRRQLHRLQASKGGDTQALLRHENARLETWDAGQASEVRAVHYRWVRSQAADHQPARVPHQQTTHARSAGQGVSNFDLGGMALLSGRRATEVDGQGEPPKPSLRTRNATPLVHSKQTGFQAIIFMKECRRSFAYLEYFRHANTST